MCEFGGIVCVKRVILGFGLEECGEALCMFLFWLAELREVDFLEKNCGILVRLGMMCCK